MGRAIPYDKHLLVVGLKELGKNVAVTGDGINDVDALKAADVGFAMGSGVSIAKDAADMILISDNFEATMNAVMWGRNIYQNVRKFIQFQVTVNFTALAFVFIGAVFKGEAALTVVQLLWVNLIMDTLAALALATERPHQTVILTPPVKKGDQVMTHVIWRQIYGMSAYMIIVLSILLFFGEFIWDIEYAKSDRFFNGDIPLNKAIHYTILFNTFIYMQIFNEINCRMVGAKQFNVFHNLQRNWVFISIVAGTAVLQYFFVQHFGQLMRVAPLTDRQHAACMLWGVSTLLVSVLLKLTPEAWSKKIPIRVDEDADASDSALVSLYNAQAKAKFIAKEDSTTVQPEHNPIE